MPTRADAQGCLLTQNSAPILGSQLSPCLQSGEWQVMASAASVRLGGQ
jgi:hypothetical protein